MQSNASKVYQHSTMSARKNVPTLPMKPYCKVCHDTGKPESVYRSHYVRTTPGPNGLIVCPTLANLECRYCHQKGHTVKHCTVLEERKKQEDKEAKRKEREQKIQEAPIKEKVITANICKNIYVCLQDNDEEEPEPQPQAQAVAMSYASALAKPAPQAEEDNEPIIKFEPVVVETKPAIYKNCRISNWADWSDSDEEDLKF